MGSIGSLGTLGNLLTSSGDSGIDVNQLLQSAEAALTIPLQGLQTQQTTVQSQQSALQSIEGDINALATAVSALGTGNGAINAFTVNSSNTNIVNASADTTATAGTHSVVVTSLATTSAYYTDPVANDTVGNGSFTISVGGNAGTTITVDNTDNTLEGLAAAINSSNAGVNASVVNDANGKRLALVSKTSGAPGAITLSANSTDLHFNLAAGGTNGSLTVDGVPISNTSNTVTGVIPGVTLNLAGASAGTTVTLSVAPDSDQAASAINAFVSAWNTVVKDFNNQFTVTPNPAGGTFSNALESDTTLRNAQEQLLSAVTSSVTGNNGFVNLASIGVTMNNDGTLSVNSATLSSALSNNFSSVQNMLQGATGLATNLTASLNQLTDPVNGSITLDLQGLNNTETSITDQIAQTQSQITLQEQSLTAQYAQLQITLQQLPLLQSQIASALGSLKTS